MKYAVNEEGVSALKTMSAAIFDATEQINGLTSALDACAGDHQDTLGPHKSSIDAVIQEIDSITKQATAPINEISETLNDIADAYQEIIGNDRISGSAGK
ncbi:MAG: hypothetical protein IJA87_02405 [Clostridia bacterium]|nr:hypothetical protein [Clostridia bacterium]